MDDSTKSLLKQVKVAPTVQSYLSLAFFYKRNGKFFSAQTVLQEALETLKPNPASPAHADLTQILEEMTSVLGDDYTPISKPPTEAWFLVASSLADLHLLQGHTTETLSSAVFAVKCHVSTSNLALKTFWNVVVCDLLEAWLRFAYIYMYKKKFEKALICYENIQRIETWIRTQSICDNERLQSVLATIQLSRYLVLKDPQALDLARTHLSTIETGESLLCFLYLTKDPRSSQVIRSMLQTHSDNVMYWVWLGLIEHNPAALRKALSLDPRNWLAWSTLGYLQHEAGAFEDCAYSLRVSYKLHYQDYRLPLLQAILHKELGNIDQAAKLTAFAIDLEPSLGFYQINSSSV